MASPRRRVLRNAIRFVAGVFACTIALVALSQARPSSHLLAQSAEVRALWVLRSSVESPDAIKRMVASAAANGFNTLFVQVRGRGDAEFSDAVGPLMVAPRQPAGFDSLADTIREAHAHGLRVHAWMNVNLVSSATALPPGRDHVIYEHPEWLMVPRELAPDLAGIDPRNPEYLGRLTRWTRANADRVDGLYISPLYTEASVRMAAAAADIATRYAIDGVHFDYVRYPGSDFDYGTGAIDRFRAEIRRPFAQPDDFPTEWRLFRQSHLTALVTRLRTSVKTVRPSAVVSIAVTADVETALRDTLQDWRTWLDSGFLDVLCPLADTMEPSEFVAQIEHALSLAGGRPVWAGIGAYRLSPEATIANIAAARRLGANGVVLFSYDSLISQARGPEYLSTITRAAF